MYDIGINDLRNAMTFTIRKVHAQVPMLCNTSIGDRGARIRSRLRVTWMRCGVPSPGAEKEEGEANAREHDADGDNGLPQTSK